APASTWARRCRNPSGIFWPPSAADTASAISNRVNVRRLVLLGQRTGEAQRILDPLHAKGGIADDGPRFHGALRILRSVKCWSAFGSPASFQRTMPPRNTATSRNPAASSRAAALAERLSVWQTEQPACRPTMRALRCGGAGRPAAG